jgi:hypothetical protein
VGDLIEVVKTKRVDKSNEYMVLASEGLFFVNIMQTKNLEGETEFKFELNTTEIYFKN